MLVLRGLRRVEQAIFNHTKEANRLLDFGAGDNRVKRKFLAASFKGSYETLDVSDTEKHTYSSLSEVTGKFDAIFCLEVIEHMSLNDYVAVSYTHLTLPTKRIV